jgi:hypothetical protein
MIRSGHLNLGFFIQIGIFLVVILLGYLSCVGIAYVITNDTLFITMWGLSMNKGIPISEIVSVKRTYNPLSSPATSLKRLSIRVNINSKFPYALISPVREQEFLDTLKAINPDIYISVNDRKAWWRIWDWDINS